MGLLQIGYHVLQNLECWSTWIAAEAVTETEIAPSNKSLCLRMLPFKHQAHAFFRTTPVPLRTILTLVSTTLTSGVNWDAACASWTLPVADYDNT